MNTEKATKKLQGAVSAYLANKGIVCALGDGLTFEMLAELRAACDPLALESEQARTAAYARLDVLTHSASNGKKARWSTDSLAIKARSLINPDAVQKYAMKRGAKYRDWVAHTVKHPRGKSTLELATCYMKLGEIDIALKGLKGDAAETVREQAINNAKMCLLACPA